MSTNGPSSVPVGVSGRLPVGLLGKVWCLPQGGRGGAHPLCGRACRLRRGADGAQGSGWRRKRALSSAGRRRLLSSAFIGPGCWSAVFVVRVFLGGGRRRMGVGARGATLRFFRGVEFSPACMPSFVNPWGVRVTRHRPRWGTLAALFTERGKSGSSRRGWSGGYGVPVLSGFREVGEMAVHAGASSGRRGRTPYAEVAPSPTLTATPGSGRSLCAGSVQAGVGPSVFQGVGVPGEDAGVGEMLSRSGPGRAW